jgi:hypothetical protein
MKFVIQCALFFCAIISGMWVYNQFVIPIYANNLE